MTTEELVAKVEREVADAWERPRAAARDIVRLVVEACAEEVSDCSCRGEDHCLCSCRRRIRKLGGTP